VTIGDHDVTKQGAARIARIGVSRSFQGPSLPPELTPRQLLGASLAQIRRVSYFHWLTSDPIAARARRASRERAGEILMAAGLGAAVDEPCSGLTSGQTRILDVVIALASHSTLVMLDEPAAGLSEVERKRLSATIRALAERGLGFLVVEHDMELAFGLADHVTVLGQGKIIADGTPDEIKENQQVRDVLIGPTE
jgi:ABC-type branched-subunit amino acid transport system ATPase component